MTFGVAEEATIASAGDNRACSNGRCGKDKHGGCKRTGTGCGNSAKKGSLCYGY